MKTVAYIGRDYRTAKNLFREMLRIAQARGLKISAALQPTPMLCVGDMTFYYFYRARIEALCGLRLDAVWVGCTLNPGQESVARAAIADSHGSFIEGTPTLEPASV